MLMYANEMLINCCYFCACYTVRGVTLKETQDFYAENVN